MKKTQSEKVNEDPEDLERFKKHIQEALYNLYDAEDFATANKIGVVDLDYVKGKLNEYIFRIEKRLEQCKKN